MSVLVATTDGYHVFTSGGDVVDALAGRQVEALTPGPAGTWIAIVDRREIWQHGADGEWRALANGDLELSCLVTVGDVVYAGSADARMLRLAAGGDLVPLVGFDHAPGRDEWHPVGYPIAVRSLTATSGGVLLANVHVGGIVRSADGGESWKPTIAVDDDIHEVRAHPSDGDVAAAAAAVGLCVSADAGQSWQRIDAGMHSTYSRVVAFLGDDVLCSASDGPFAQRGAIYRLPVGARALERVRNGLPEWLDGNVDTRCLAAGPKGAALADQGGNVWISSDGISDWKHAASLGRVTAVAIS